MKQFYAKVGTARYLPRTCCAKALWDYTVRTEVKNGPRHRDTWFYQSYDHLTNTTSIQCRECKKPLGDKYNYTGSSRLV